MANGKQIMNTNISANNFEEILTKRNHADYKGYMKLLEIMAHLPGKTQREVIKIRTEREELNDQLLTLLTHDAGGNTH